MAKRAAGRRGRQEELLEKLIAINLHALGLSQGRIGKVIGRQKAWVTDLLRGLPRGGRGDGRHEKVQKAKRRSRR